MTGFFFCAQARTIAIKSNGTWHSFCFWTRKRTLAPFVTKTKRVDAQGGKMLNIVYNSDNMLMY